MGTRDKDMDPELDKAQLEESKEEELKDENKNISS